MKNDKRKELSELLKLKKARFDEKAAMESYNAQKEIYFQAKETNVEGDRINITYSLAPIDIIKNKRWLYCHWLIYTHVETKSEEKDTYETLSALKTDFEKVVNKQLRDLTPSNSSFFNSNIECIITMEDLSHYKINTISAQATYLKLHQDLSWRVTLD
ncbi:MAG: hypothetical protein WC916_06990 [Candidatus Woesearchaeota archaeon]